MPDTAQQVEQQVENKLNESVPAAVRPEVQGVEHEANAELAAEAAKAPAAEAAAAASAPAVEQAAQEARSIASGRAVPLTELISTGTALAGEVKSGYKTTEFWLTGAVIVFSQIGALTIPGKFGPVIAEVASAASAGLYALSRGLAKKR